MATLFSTFKAIWLLLVASALIWSGVSLTAAPRTADAALFNSNSATIDQNPGEDDEGGGDSDSGLRAGNSRQTSSMPNSGSQSPQLLDPMPATGYSPSTEV